MYNLYEMKIKELENESRISNARSIKMTNLYFTTCAIAMLMFFCPARAQDRGAMYLDAKMPVEKRVDDLLKRMTIKEKIGQMVQLTGNFKGIHSKDSGLDDLLEPVFKVESSEEYAKKFDSKQSMVLNGEVGSFLKVPGIHAANYLQKLASESRLKIPLLISSEAVHGHSFYSGAATIFPTQIGLASTFSPELAELMGEVTAAEMRATGYNWTLNPNVEVVRDQRWGRSGESSGEDPFLVGEMGRAMVRGYQGETLGPHSVLACLRHMAVGGEPFNGINAGEADISERTLHSIYLPPFEVCIKEGCYTVMAAHNSLNGIPCHAHKGLLTDILRTEWDFEGFVVSDWMDVGRLHSVLKVADSYTEACRMAVDAGIDHNMHGAAFLKAVEELVSTGQLSEERINAAVRPILRAKFLLGLFESKYPDPAKADDILFCQEHKDAALEVTRKSLVLLKNDNNTLPLPANTGSILITGPLAHGNQCQLGDWSTLQPDKNLITVLEGIQEAAPKNTKVNFVDCGNTFEINPDVIAKAAKVAESSDYAVVVVGENSLRVGEWKKTAGENCDYTTLDLPGNQRQLIQALHKTGTPVIVVLINGRALSVTWCAENVPAILEAWEPGLLGGQAIAEAIFGKINPSGKLPISFPRSSGHLKSFYNHTPLRLKKYGNSTASPLFPFGHGLSYTTFTYANLKCQKMAKIDETVTVSVDVTNSGDQDGDEIVLLYINDRISSVVTPIKELKAFQRVSLKAGETKTVTLKLVPDAFSLINADIERIVEPGLFDIMVSTEKAVLKIVD